jgi:hypothetical protein
VREIIESHIITQASSFRILLRKKKLLEVVAAVKISMESWEEEEGATSPDHLPQTSVSGKSQSHGSPSLFLILGSRS